MIKQTSIESGKFASEGPGDIVILKQPTGTGLDVLYRIRNSGTDTFALNVEHLDEMDLKAGGSIDVKTNGSIQVIANADGAAGFYEFLK